MGFRVLVSRHPAIQATGLLTVTPAGLSPAEHASLRWTHNRAGGYSAHGLTSLIQRPEQRFCHSEGSFFEIVYFMLWRQSQMIYIRANIDENLRRLNMENLMYPGPVVPFIGYQSNDDDMYSKIPNSKGDDIPEIELSTLEAKNMAVKISISEKG